MDFLNNDWNGAGSTNRQREDEELAHGAVDVGEDVAKAAIKSARFLRAKSFAANAAQIAVPAGATLAPSNHLLDAASAAGTAALTMAAQKVIDRLGSAKEHASTPAGASAFTEAPRSVPRGVSAPTSPKVDPETHSSIFTPPEGPSTASGGFRTASRPSRPSQPPHEPFAATTPIGRAIGLSRQFDGGIDTEHFMAAPGGGSYIPSSSPLGASLSKARSARAFHQAAKGRSSAEDTLQTAQRDLAPGTVRPSSRLAAFNGSY